MTKINDEAKKGGVKSKQGLYAYASKHSKEAIDVLYDLMKNSNNDGIRLGAAKALLNKTLPDVKDSDDNSDNSSRPIIWQEVGNNL